MIQKTRAELKTEIKQLFKGALERCHLIMYYY